jgi:hypothetical protein
MTVELIEDCCFNERRDLCMGKSCACGCHVVVKRRNRVSSDIETPEELVAIRAAYETALNESAIDPLDDGGPTRRAFRAGWLAGRDWVRREVAAQE